MFVRISIVTGATAIDAGLEFLREEVVPQLQQQKGFRGLSASGDRAAGVVNVLSTWETEEDLSASESAADKARGSALQVLGGRVTVERYEQNVWEMGESRPGPGTKLHIRTTHMEPSRIDDNLAYFRETVVPQMKATPGFQGVRHLINRETGEGRVGTLWANEDALTEALARAEERRASAADRGVQFGEDLVLDVLYATT